MNNAFFSEPWALRLGWTLLHFIWQGAVIALLLTVVLRVMARASSHARYLVICGAMAACALVPAMTWMTIVLPDEAATTAVPAAGPLPADASIATAAVAHVVISDKAQLPAPAGEIDWRSRLAQIASAALPYLVAVWLCGVVLLTARLTLGWSLARRMARVIAPIRDAACGERFQRLKARMRVSAPVRLVESALVEVPTLIGWLRPTILLPASVLAGLTPDQLDAILAHELAHVRRCDYLVNLFQAVIETVLFYHPAVWWISRKLREERENCCDDIALEVMQDRLVYISALAQLEAGRTLPLALTASGGSLLQRIKRIVGAKERRVSAWPLWILIAGLLTAACVTQTKAKEADAPKPEEPAKHIHLYVDFIEHSRGSGETEGEDPQGPPRLGGLAAEFGSAVLRDPVNKRQTLAGFSLQVGKNILKGKTPNGFAYVLTVDWDGLLSKNSGDYTIQIQTFTVETDAKSLTYDNEYGKPARLEEGEYLAADAPSKSAPGGRLLFSVSEDPTGNRASIYPVKKEIITSIFWLDKDLRRSTSNAPTPFYAALPFNDILHPDAAKKWLPAGWSQNELSLNSKGSACLGRWLKITNAAGVSCYAQWEDFGPGSDDDAEYVFGNKAPKSTLGTGIDLSPVTAKFLGIDDMHKTVSWQFVDVSDVPNGPWIKLPVDLHAEIKNPKQPSEFSLVSDNPAADQASEKMLDAIKKGDTAAAQKLIDQGIDLSKASDNFVYWAVYYNQADVLDLLLKHNAVANVRGPDDKSPLALARDKDSNLAEIVQTGMDRDRQAHIDKLTAKLNAIHIDLPAFTDTPLIDVITLLDKKAHEADPAGEGISIVVRKDPLTNSAKVTLPESKNVSLASSFLIITAQTNLDYVVDEDYVGIKPQPTDRAILNARTYAAPPGFFAAKSGDTIDVTRELKNRGISFPDGAYATYLPGSGKVIVRNTSDELDKLTDLLNPKIFLNPKGSVTIKLKLIEISEETYQANHDKIDEALKQGKIDFVSDLKSADMLAAPSVTTPEGKDATIEVVREFPYPTAFELPKTAVVTVPNSPKPVTVAIPATPTQFVTKDVGITAVLKPQSYEGKIVLSGKLTVTEFDGFTPSDLGTASATNPGLPSFTTKESGFLEAVEDNQPKAIWIPGGRLDEQTITDTDLRSGKKTTTQQIVKKRLLMILTAHVN